MFAKTRITFQAGRVSPNGLTTAWKLCKRPSAFTKLPEVSVKGAVGSITSQTSILALNGFMLTTICACNKASLASFPAAESNSGSLFKSNTAFKPCLSFDNIWPADKPFFKGCAPTYCAPTVFAASVR